MWLMMSHHLLKGLIQDFNHYYELPTIQLFAQCLIGLTLRPVYYSANTF